MITLEHASNVITNWLPFMFTIAAGVVSLILFQKLISYRARQRMDGTHIYMQLALFLAGCLFLVVLVLSTPLSETMKGQLISLLGITFTAAVALSSTTFLGNIMAGLMIKVLGKLRTGDFVNVSENFGRITELRLLHAEIQNEDRSLTTLPNMYLITNPVKVIRSSGTVISEDITLGYDVHYNKIEDALMEAARKTGLEDCFMHIQKLGDFSITYRISGFLKDVKTLISSKAKLRENILDSLHGDQIEIVSPTFMNQRIYPADKHFIPRYERERSLKAEELPEDIIFDKAEEAVSLEKIKERISELESAQTALEKNEELDAEEKTRQLEICKTRKERLIKLLKERSAEPSE